MKINGVSLKSRRFAKKFSNSEYRHSFNLIVFDIILIVFSLSLILYRIFSKTNDNSPYSITLFIMLIVSFLSLSLALTKKSVLSKISIFLLCLMIFVSTILTLIYGDGTSFSVLIWIMFVPFISMLLLGLGYGTIYSVVILILIPLFLFAKPDWMKYEMSYIAKLRFYGACIMSYFLGLLFEFSRFVSENSQKRLLEMYKQTSYVDYLTKLHNRLWLADYIEKHNSSIKVGSNFSIMMIDCDYFKKVNDVYGHIFGDRVLVDVSNILSNYGGVNAVRWGGDEFLILCEDMPKERACIIAEAIRKDVSMIHYDDVPEFSFTVSIGVCFARVTTSFDYNEVMRIADEQSSRAKQHGKNCVYTYDIK